MKTFRAEISNTVPQLAPLMARRYGKANTPFTYQEVNQSVSKNLAKAYALLYKILTGNDIQDDTVLFTVNSADGAFKRFYGPSICRNAAGDGLILLMGSESIPLKLVKGQLKDIQIPEGKDFSLKLAQEEVGDFKETVIKFSVFIEADDLILVYPIQLRLQLTEDDKGKKVEPDFDTLEQVFSRSTTKLLPLIGDVPNISDFDGPLIKLSQLDENSVYQVFGVRSCKPGGRLSFIMAIRPTEEDQGYAEENGDYVTFEQAEVWGNSAIKNVLQSKPEITEEKPAELVIRGMRTNSSGTTTVDCSLILTQPEIDPATLEEELDFSF
jgi:hypothetical protein